MCHPVPSKDILSHKHNTIIPPIKLNHKKHLVRNPHSKCLILRVLQRSCQVFEAVCFKPRFDKPLYYMIHSGGVDKVPHQVLIFPLEESAKRVVLCCLLLAVPGRTQEPSSGQDQTHALCSGTVES